jgi:hypothetical protein
MERMSCRRYSCLAPAAGGRARPRPAWSPARWESSRQQQRTIGWQRSNVSFCGATCIHPQLKYALPVTHKGRLQSIHDYNTLECRSQHDACRARRRDALSGSGLPPYLQLSPSASARATVRTSVCAHPASFSSDVPRVQPCHWLHTLRQSKRRHCPNVAPGDAVVG